MLSFFLFPDEISSQEFFQKWPKLVPKDLGIHEIIVDWPSTVVRASKLEKQMFLNVLFGLN